VIKGFILPEMPSFARQHGVCMMSGRAFNPIRYARERQLWSDQQVDMVGHYYEGMKGEIAKH
jgi:hypothetical protein